MNLASRLNALIPLTLIPLTPIPLWLDAPRVQCARTFANHPERFRAFEVFRAGTRGAGAPHPTSEFGLIPPVPSATSRVWRPRPRKPWA